MTLWVVQHVIRALHNTVVSPFDILVTTCRPLLASVVAASFTFVVQRFTGHFDSVLLRLSLAGGLLQKLRGRPQPAPLINGLGRAPYSHVDCSSGAELVEKLGRAIAQLRDVAEQEGRPLERDSLDEHRRKGAAAAEAGQNKQALQEYAAALRFAVQQLRDRTRDRKDD